jgi:hypothetical protein
MVSIRYGCIRRVHYSALPAFKNWIAISFAAQPCLSIQALNGKLRAFSQCRHCANLTTVFPIFAHLLSSQFQTRPSQHLQSFKVHGCLLLAVFIQTSFPVLQSKFTALQGSINIHSLPSNLIHWRVAQATTSDQHPTVSQPRIPIRSIMRDPSSRLSRCLRGST